MEFKSLDYRLWRADSCSYVAAYSFSLLSVGVDAADAVRSYSQPALERLVRSKPEQSSLPRVTDTAANS